MTLDKPTIKKIIFIIFAGILFYVGMNHLQNIWDALGELVNILTPIILGLCLAFLLDPLVESLEKNLFFGLKNKLPKYGKVTARGLSILLALVIVAGFLALIVLLVIPEVKEAFTVILDTLPNNINKAVKSINGLLEKLDVEFRLPSGGGEDWADFIKSAKQYIENAFNNGVIGDIANTAISVLSGIFSFLMGIIFSIYVLAQKEKICIFFRRLVKASSKKKTSDRVFGLWGLTRTSFRNFVTGQLTEACIIAMLCFFGMIIFRFPYPTAASAVIGLSALIPVFGAWIGAIVGFLLALSHSFSKAVLFILFIVILQQLEGNLIYPRVVGRSMGLPGILVFVSVLLGASFGGIAGMLLAVPLFSIFYTLLRRFISFRLGETEEPPVPTERSSKPPEPEAD